MGSHRQRRRWHGSRPRRWANAHGDEVVGRRLAAVFNLVVATVLLVATAGGVGAHADLLRAEPAVDARLAQPPAQLTLHFSQGLKQEGSFIQIENVTGTR